MLNKVYWSLEDAANQLQCQADDLIQFAAYGQIELCVLIPRNYVSPVIHREDGTLDEFERTIRAEFCGPCALYPLQWKMFLANRDCRTYSIRRIYSGYPEIESTQEKDGFKDWVILPGDNDPRPITIAECEIVIRQEELDRVCSEQQSGRRVAVVSDNTLAATIAALLASWPGGKPPTGKDLEKAAASVGVAISDDSIRKALKAVRELAPSLPSA